MTKTKVLRELTLPWILESTKSIKNLYLSVPIVALRGLCLEVILSLYAHSAQPFSGQ